MTIARKNYLNEEIVPLSQSEYDEMNDIWDIMKELFPDDPPISTSMIWLNKRWTELWQRHYESGGR